MTPPSPVPLTRCVMRAVTEEGYKRVMSNPPGTFSLQAEIAKDHDSLRLHQVLPDTAAYPALRVVDLIPATHCSLSADDAVTMVVLPPAPLISAADVDGVKEPGDTPADAAQTSLCTSTITVRLNASLRGSTALASAAAFDALLLEDECLARVCGSQTDCVFVVEAAEASTICTGSGSGASSPTLEVGPELFRNMRGAFYSHAAQTMTSATAPVSYADTTLVMPADVFAPVEDAAGELLHRAAATELLALSKIVLCPAIDDAALTELYGLYYPDLCALFGAAAAAAWEGQLVSTGDVLLLDAATLDGVAERMEGVDVLESVARVLSHKVRSWRGSWVDEFGTSPHLLALRVVRAESPKGVVPYGVLRMGSSGDGVEVVLVHQRNLRFGDATPVLPPSSAGGLLGVEVFRKITTALRSAITPSSLDGGLLHTFVVHGVKENLTREFVQCAIQQFGLPCVVAAADGMEEAELEDVMHTFLTEQCGGATALLLHNAHLIASASPHLLSLLDRDDGAAAAAAAHIAGPRMLFLLCESMEAVPPMIAARATNAEGVLECGNPSEEDRAGFIGPVLQWSSQRHRVHTSLLLSAKTFAGWTVGLTYADILSLVEECARAAQHAVQRGSGEGAMAVISDVSCEPVVQAYMKSHGYNMVSTKLQPVRWSDVGGLEEAKRELRETIQLPILHPELFENGMKKRTGVLFYGPPGCGKTLLAKAVATEMNMNFMSVKGPELINQYVGESEKNIRLLFQRARDNSPCIVFFDELDALAPARGAKGDAGGVMDRIVSQLLVEVDGVGQKRSDGTASGDVFIIGATNRPDLLDAALLRPGRFDRLCYLGIPSSREEQLFALRALTRKFDMEGDVDLEALLEPLDFLYTGADFFALCSDAMMFAVEDALEEAQEQLTSALQAEQGDASHPGAALNTAAQGQAAAEDEEASKPIKVCMEHFVRARAQLKPSVTKADLHKYEALKQKFNKSKDA